jgi:hypothetical protein
VKWFVPKDFQSLDRIKDSEPGDTLLYDANWEDDVYNVCVPLAVTTCNAPESVAFVNAALQLEKVVSLDVILHSKDFWTREAQIRRFKRVLSDVLDPSLKEIFESVAKNWYKVRLTYNERSEVYYQFFYNDTYHISRTFSQFGTAEDFRIKIPNSRDQKLNCLVYSALYDYFIQTQPFVYVRMETLVRLTSPQSDMIYCNLRPHIYSENKFDITMPRVLESFAPMVFSWFLPNVAFRHSSVCPYFDFWKPDEELLVWSPNEKCLYFFYTVLLDICISLAPLRLPAYVVLWIADYAFEMITVREILKIRAIEKFQSAIKAIYNKKENKNKR